MLVSISTSTNSEWDALAKCHNVILSNVHFRMNYISLDEISTHDENFVQLMKLV